MTAALVYAGHDRILHATLLHTFIQHISPYQLPRCLGAHYLVYKQNSKKAALRWSTRMNQVYPKLVEPYQRRAPFFGFCLQVFRQHTSPHRLDYLARLGNERKVCFARTQRRIASLGIEPEASNLSITNLTLYQLSSQPSSLYIGVDAEVWFMPGVPFFKVFSISCNFQERRIAKLQIRTLRLDEHARKMQVFRSWQMFTHKKKHVIKTSELQQEFSR